MAVRSVGGIITDEEINAMVKDVENNRESCRGVRDGDVTLRKIAICLSKNCQKLDIFFKKIVKIFIFFEKNVKFLTIS